VFSRFWNGKWASNDGSNFIAHIWLDGEKQFPTLSSSPTPFPSPPPRNNNINSHSDLIIFHIPSHYWVMSFILNMLFAIKIHKKHCNAFNYISRARCATFHRRRRRSEILAFIF